MWTNIVFLYLCLIQFLKLPHFRFIPDWLTSVYKNQWFAMLRTEFDNDNG